jgi:hypothetical protein
VEHFSQVVTTFLDKLTTKPLEPPLEPPPSSTLFAKCSCGLKDTFTDLITGDIWHFIDNQTIHTQLTDTVCIYILTSLLQTAHSATGDFPSLGPQSYAHCLSILYSLRLPHTSKSPSLSSSMHVPCTHPLYLSFLRTAMYLACYPLPFTTPQSINRNSRPLSNSHLPLSMNGPHTSFCVAWQKAYADLPPPPTPLPPYNLP